MRSRFLCAAIAVACFAMLAARVSAQNTINVTMQPFVSTYAFGPGSQTPISIFVAGDIDPPGYTSHIEGVQPGSYFELKVTTTTPGWYTIGTQSLQTQDPHTILMFETRPFSSPENIYATHYATGDSSDLGTHGAFGTSITPRTYVTTDPIMSSDGTTPLKVPLLAGDNVLRVRNVGGRHSPATTYPPDLSDPNDRPQMGDFFWSNVQFLTFTLKRVGDLPAMGTISGTVTGNQPAGIPVQRGIVVASDPGKAVPEVNSWWHSGWYTYTKVDGTYTLQAPVGTVDVKAGRPSSYQAQGTLNAGVVVPATGTVTSDFQLPSIWFKDTSGDWVAHPQFEYQDFKTNPNAGDGLLPVDGQNGYKLGWTDLGGTSNSLILDVPVSGNYEVTDSYDNGGGTGTVRISSNLGPFTQDTQDPVGWAPVVNKLFANPIYLAEGTQIVTIALLSGQSDYDGMQLRQLHTPVTVGVVQGTVSDSLTGNPVAGAAVTFGNASVTTDATGHYKGVANAGTAQTFTVVAPYQDVPYSSTVDVSTTSTTTKNVSVPIRPHIVLSTVNGYNFKALLNTGDTPDYSAVSADESAFKPYVAPGSWDAIDTTDDIYGWIRVHFTVPADFKTVLPGRAVRLHVSGGGIDDVDKTFVNGTEIGQTGKFPNPALPVQPAGHTNPPTGIPYAISYPGLDQAWPQERIYTFPASLLTSGDNVLAIKCFDLTGAGGLIGTASLEVAPPTGAVTGTVKIGGVGVANARVAVSNASAVSSAWGWTDANGAFSLPFAAAGAGVLGVTKLGMNSIITPVMVPSAGTLTLNLTTTAVTPAGDAPMYDNFDDNAGAPTWQNKWWPVALEDNSNPANIPSVAQPGYDVNQGPSATIPSTVTVYQTGGGHRNSIISKDRFSRFASVNEAKLVSAKGPVLTTDDWGVNTILNLNGNAAPDASVPTPGIFSPNVELDLEGWRSDGTNNVVQWIVWDSGGRRSNGIVPGGLAKMADVTPANPLVLAINRTGSVYDFFINGTLVHTDYDAISMPDTRIALYGYQLLVENTWDYVAAGPIAATGVKGDVNANGILEFGDVVSALRIAGGLDVSTSAQVTAGNQAGSDSIISVLDAVRIDQALNGKPL